MQISFIKKKLLYNYIDETAINENLLPLGGYVKGKTNEFIV